jgi:hypothetical protein
LAYCSRDPDFLADLVGLPERFVTLVLRIAKYSKFWWCEQLFDLEVALYKNADDLADIQDALRFG